MILKKEFYFIRHGQTDYNISNCKVDYEDVSLNAVGFQQAEDHSIGFHKSSYTVHMLFYGDK